MADESEVDKRIVWVEARLRAAYSHLKPGFFDKLFPVEENTCVHAVAAPGLRGCRNPSAGRYRAVSGRVRAGGGS